MQARLICLGMAGLVLAIAAAWEKITDQIGRESQLKLYRSSLGLS